MTLEPGSPAPVIRTQNQAGEVVELDGSEPTVLYFYPRDNTSGCTIEATQFQAALESYREVGVTVYGISTDDVDSHADFATDQQLEFDLLADPDGEIATAYEVELRGGPPPAAARTTYVLIDANVHDVYESVDPDGHARTVLENLIEEGVVDVEV